MKKILLLFLIVFISLLVFLFSLYYYRNNTTEVNNLINESEKRINSIIVQISNDIRDYGLIGQAYLNRLEKKEE